MTITIFSSSKKAETDCSAPALFLFSVATTYHLLASCEIMEIQPASLLINLSINGKLLLTLRPNLTKIVEAVDTTPVICRTL